MGNIRSRHLSFRAARSLASRPQPRRSAIKFFTADCYEADAWETPGRAYSSSVVYNHLSGIYDGMTFVCLFFPNCQMANKLIYIRRFAWPFFRAYRGTLQQSTPVRHRTCLSKHDRCRNIVSVHFLVEWGGGVKGIYVSPSHPLFNKIANYTVVKTLYFFFFFTYFWSMQSNLGFFE